MDSEVEAETPTSAVEAVLSELSAGSFAQRFNVHDDAGAVTLLDRDGNVNEYELRQSHGSQLWCFANAIETCDGGGTPEGEAVFVKSEDVWVCWPCNDVVLTGIATP